MNTFSIKQGQVDMNHVLTELQTDMFPVLIHNPFQQAVDDVLKWSLSWTRLNAAERAEQCLNHETPRHAPGDKSGTKELKTMIAQLNSEPEMLEDNPQFTRVAQTVLKQDHS